MSLASPDRLMWLLVALPIIAFYILKTRLRRRQVATLLFWDQIFEEKRQRSLWQNLRHWLSLLLQLIFVGLIGFALADPLWRSQSNSGQELILVVDNSASMRAVDPETGRSRLDEALDQANEVAKGLRQGDQIALMTAGSIVDVKVGMTDFAPAIQEALLEIEPTDGPTKVDEAITAARRLSNDAERRRIVVFTDGCVANRKSGEGSEDENDAEPEFADVPPADDLRMVQVGVSQDNIGITTFQVRRSVTDPIGYALLIEVQNFGDTDAEARLKLELAESLVDVIPLKLAAGGSFRTTIDGTSREGGVLTATIDIEDGLTTDNIAQAIVPPRPFIPVTLVSADEAQSFYLRSVLESVPLVKLTDAGADFDPNKANKNSLTVFSGVTPTTIPPGPTLIVNAAENGPKVGEGSIAANAWAIGKAIDAPIIAKQEKQSPLLRHVQLQNVILAGGRDIEVNDNLGDATTLLETAEGARVLVSVERTSGRVLILAADLETSDLPLRIAFPVMMTNAMNWFFRETGDMNPALTTGKIATVHWDLGEQSTDDDSMDSDAVLVDPAGDNRVITINKNRAAVGPIDQVGVYGLVQSSSLPEPDDESEEVQPRLPAELLAAGARGELVAVNLCDSNESDLRLPELPENAQSDPPASGSLPWFYLSLFALGLVVSEWVLFNRRVVA